MSQEIISIIYWTTWFGEKQWEGYNIDNCGLPYTCQFTHDRDRATNTSVYVFHASDLTKKDMPPARHDRAWVYHNAEAPKNDQADLINQMQYSMTYRLDSDFPWGYLEQKQLLPSMTTPIVAAKPKRRASVAWIVSNCKASNYRHHFVRKLAQYIDIDIYGHCMNNQPFPDDTSTVELMSQYHFYLSIENSNCKDYVTEKLSNAYLAGTVPIVDGPSDYGPFIPNTHSVIRIDEFPSPKALADHLHKVLNNKSLYDHYLDYRKTGLSERFKATLQAFEQGRCNLCQLAHQRHQDMANNYYPGKKIYLDNTCIAHKHYRPYYSATWRAFVPLFLLTCLLVLYFFRKKLMRFINKKI
ncbi:Alpha 1,3 fucosyltransferase [Rhizopus stolonifer]|uniref:Fucosyltransferase n=1 Tax=Rhizopus stolonifer TaxID=4846 RepID=A0A367KVR4_RHIST|nr:Alpha 1,3 fucosyltransferase [Rhizopus stolonifer]